MKRAILVSLLLFVQEGMAAAVSADGSEDEPAASPPADVLRRLWTDARASWTVRLDYFRSDRELNDKTDFFGATTQIKLLPSLGANLDGKLEARLTNPDLGDHGKTKLALLEGYLAWHIGKADVRLGRQIVPWGRADGINPTDNLTPRDYKVLLPFEEDQRFGLWALKADYALTPDYTLTAFTTPWFESEKVPLTGPAIADRRPVSSLANTEFAFKLNRTGGAVDWSLSYFHGYSPLASAHLPAAGENGPSLELRYDKIDVVGADFARNFGRYGFRGELAYFFTGDRNGHDPFVKNPYLFVVLGEDRTFFDNLNINLQFVGRWVSHYSDPGDVADPLIRQVSELNALAAGQQDRVSYGLSSRIGKKWFNDTLEAEILLFADFTRSSAYIRPLVTYALADHVKCTVGADLYTGASQTVFGQLKRNQGVFVEMRYSF